MKKELEILTDIRDSIDKLNQAFAEIQIYCAQLAERSHQTAECMGKLRETVQWMAEAQGKDK